MSIKSKKSKNLIPQVMSFVFKLTLILGIFTCLILQFLLIAQNEILNQKISQKNDLISAQIKDVHDWQIQFESRVFTKAGNTPDPTPSAPTSDERRLGKADTQYSLIVYTDLECPFCKQAYPIEKSFIEKNKDISLVYRHFPLESIHPDAFKLALMTECSFDQKGLTGFWNSVETILSSSDLKGLETKDFANLLGLKPDDLEECLNQESTKQKINEAKEEAINANIQGTPALFLYNQKTNGFKFIDGLASLDQIQNQFNEFKSK